MLAAALARGQDFFFQDRMSETNEALKQTPLYALHLELGGKLVPFAANQGRNGSAPLP